MVFIVVFIGNQQQWEYDGYRTGWWFSNILGINQPEWECNMDRMGYIYIYIPVVPHKAVAEVSKIGNL